MLAAIEALSKKEKDKTQENLTNLTSKCSFGLGMQTTKLGMLYAYILMHKYMMYICN